MHKCTQSDDCVKSGEEEDMWVRVYECRFVAMKTTQVF